MIESLRQRGANNDTKRVASDCIIDLTQDCSDEDEIMRNPKKACHELFEIATYNTNDLLRRYINGDVPAIRNFLYRNRPSVMCFQEVWIPCAYRGSYPAGIADHGALPKKIRAAKWPNETKQFDELHQALYPSGEDLVQLLVGEDYRSIVSLSPSRRQGSIVAVRRDSIYQPSYIVFNYVDAEICAQDTFGCSIPAGPNPYTKKYKEGHHPEGRIIILGFALFDLICTYTVWSGVTNPSKREEWDRQMYLFVTRARKRGRHIVWIGDLNIAPTPADVSHPLEMIDIPGFTPPECQRFHTIEQDGDLRDAYRACHPCPVSNARMIENNGDIDQAHYTWRNMSASHPQARGMRLDHALVSKSLLPLVRSCEIIGTANMSDFFGSDHCPLVLSLDTGARKP